MADVDNSHGITLDNTETQQYAVGLKITVGGSATYLKKVTKHSICTGTTCWLTSATDKTVALATATFSGDVATFSSPYQMSASTVYYVLTGITLDGSGANFDSRRKLDVPGLPIASTELTFNGGWNAADYSHFWNIVTITTNQSLATSGFMTLKKGSW